jgi:hypothetical protein
MHLFEKGWNKLRQQIFENQKRLGVIPQDTKLTPWEALGHATQIEALDAQDGRDGSLQKRRWRARLLTANPALVPRPTLRLGRS